MELSRVVTGYLRPGSLPELDSILSDPPAGIRVLAGGTDLVVRIRAGREGPGPLHFLSLGGIPELRVFGTAPGGWLEIGAMATLATLASCPAPGVRDSLREAARSVAGPSIRTTATAGGNVCNASPSADMSVALLAADAEAVGRLPGGGEVLIPLAEFFRGPGRTALPDGAVLRSLRIPPAVPGLWTGFRKLGLRSVMEIAVVNLAWEIETGPEGVCRTARIALGAVAPTPIRVPAAEAVLAGLVPGTAEWMEASTEAGRRASEAARPISDQRASADYRKAMIGALLADELSRAGRRNDSLGEGEEA